MAQKIKIEKDKTHVAVSGHPKMFGCESSAAPAVQLSEKTSGAPISAAIRFTAISATTKSITAAKVFGRKTV